MKKVREAFTLAEVLIVITIIGVVAAMTLPTLLDVNQDKVWNTSAEVFEAKMYQALKLMNVKSDLARLDSTEDFINNFEKYMKISKKCDKDHLDECFTKKFSLVLGKTITKPKLLKGEGGFNFTTSANLGHADWETNIIGLQFTNGITALLAYNAKNCMPKSNSQSDLSNCIAMVYDVNANSDPNTVKHDIRTYNAPVLGENCSYYAAGYCIAFVPVSADEPGLDCTQAENSVRCAGTATDSGGNASFANMIKDSRLAVASNKCKEIGMTIATYQQLNSIINEIDKQEFADVAQQYGINAFSTRTCYNNWPYCDYYDNTRLSMRGVNAGGPTSDGITVNVAQIGVCVKAESN